MREEDNRNERLKARIPLAQYACGMRQRRHISFLCEHDSFYPFSTSLPHTLCGMAK